MNKGGGRENQALKTFEHVIIEGLRKEIKPLVFLLCNGNSKTES